MPTKITFETATIADAIKKADRVAPSKGEAFDKAAGIVMEIDPTNELPVVIRATNLNIFSTQWVAAVEIEGDPATWRLPSRLMAHVTTNLPIGTGRTVTLESKDNGIVNLSSNRTRVRFNLMTSDTYPSWKVLDPDRFSQIENLGGQISRVEWAADKSSEPLCGVHIDGACLTATDRYRLARVPMAIAASDLAEPITIPAGILGSLLRQTGEVAVGTDGSHLFLMPDDYSQLMTVIYSSPYPSLNKIIDRSFSDSVSVCRVELLEMMNRASGFAESDRFPTLRIYLGKHEIAFMVENGEVGLFGDVIELPGQCDHSRIEVKFTPKNIIEAISNAPGRDVILHYNSASPTGIMMIQGEQDYNCWVVPKKDLSTKVE